MSFVQRPVAHPTVSAVESAAALALGSAPPQWLGKSVGRFRAGTAGARGDWRAERETHADKHKPLARHTARSLLAREASAAGRHGARVAAEGLGRHAAAGLLSVLAGALPELAGLATIACSALWARWSWLSVARLAWTPASSQQGDEMGPPHAALNGESLCYFARLAVNQLLKLAFARSAELAL